MSSFECSHCGNDIGSKTEANLHIPSTPSAMGSHSLQQSRLLSIENSISGLNQARSAILRNINNTQATTRNLPFEVLSTIFRLSSPPIDFNYHYLDLEKRSNIFHAEYRFYYTVAAVSNHWRQIALSIPQLWATVILQIKEDPSHLSVQRNISFLDLHIQRSRNTPISVELIFKSPRFFDEADYAYGEDDYYLHLDKAFDEREDCLGVLEHLRTAVFVNKASMIRDLLLISPPVEWLKSVNENLAQCRSVTVFQPKPKVERRYDQMHGRLSLVKLPCLRRVQLINWRYRTVSVPAFISTLQLRDMTPWGSNELLSTCKDLVNLEIVGFIPDPGREPRCPTEPLIFRYLEHLSWSNDSFWSDPPTSSSGVHLFHLLRLPKLRSLVWADDQDSLEVIGGSWKDIRGYFFTHLPPSLSCLTFLKFKPYTLKNATLRYLLERVPQVSELHFVHCSELAVKNLIEIIGRPLSTTETSEGSISMTSVLPNLRTLSISTIFPVRDFCLEDVVGMLEALLVTRKKGQRFHLNMQGSITWNDDEQVLRRLKALVKNGFALEFVIDKVILDLSTE